MVRRFHIQNFGCRATQADGAALGGLLEKQGLEAATEPAGADVVILNTCTVTAAADEDVRKSIHRVRRRNPAARILVTGCYAQRAPEELSRLPGVAWVVGNSHKTLIPELLAGARDGAPFHGRALVGDLSAPGEFLSAPVDGACGDRTRPNLKIQDGCNHRCAFCVIPPVRGPSRSLAPERAIAEVRALAARYREVVLTGINLGRWGREPGLLPGGRMRLVDLLRRLLDETDIGRLRLSSIEPMDLSGDLLELMASTPRLCRHVHAPLQSGADGVLRRMQRRYRARHYVDRIGQVQALLPDAAIGADVMTGFPGETESEFLETLELVERLPFAYLHVFTYSARPGTRAAALPAQTPHGARKERTRALRDLSARKNLEFRRRMAGRTLSAVTLPGGQALTTNYIRVAMAVPRPPNRLVDLALATLTPGGLAESGALPVLAC
jgi:threonylcarbamoyladenosine tRNA methylthiotransferase MtaB